MRQLKNKFISYMLLAICSALVSGAISAEETELAGKKVSSIGDTANPHPVTKRSGEKWVIGYYQGGPYIDYKSEFQETIQVLMENGWFEKVEIPEFSGEDTRPLWDWLADNLQSDYIELRKDAFYDAGWDDSENERIFGEFLEKAQSGKYVDVMLAAGTLAGKTFATDKLMTPTFVISSSDPLAAGVIKSTTYSGYPNLNATVDPEFYSRQIKLFYDLVGFKKLGIAYEDTVIGRSYAAVDQVNQISREFGFEVVPCFVKSDIPESDVSEKSSVQCMEKLAIEADAIYVTQQGGIKRSNMSKIAKIAIDAHVPTFSQWSAMVAHGALFSISDRKAFHHLGRHYAENMSLFFNGKRIDSLTLMFESPLDIAFNEEAARLIGFEIPMLIKPMVDQTYTSIIE